MIMYVLGENMGSYELVSLPMTIYPKIGQKFWGQMVNDAAALFEDSFPFQHYFCSCTSFALYAVELKFELKNVHL